MPGPAQDRAQARAGEEQQAGQRQQDAEDRRAGRAEAERDQIFEAAAEGAAVAGAERQHQADDREREAEAERANVDERAARDDQHAERDEDERRQVGGVADALLDQMADRAAVEAEPEDGGEEDARARRAPSPISSGW